MFDSDRIAVTGLGLALPGGCDVEALWQRLAAGTPAFAPCYPYGERGPAVWAGQVDDGELEPGISKRNAKKIDRFTLLAMSAARAALVDAGLAESDARDRVGMVIGNATGGWTFVEPMMYGLYTEGMHAINAYVATAWFPAAAQGEISIFHRLSGYSKTLSADRLSSGLALHHAARVVESGREPVILAGGAEAPLSALVLNAHRAAGACSEGTEHAAFDEGGSRALLAEGAAFVALEDEAHARARGARVRAKLRGLGRAARLEDAIRGALSSAGCGPRDVDLVILEGAGKPELDAVEYEALGAVFAGHEALRMSAPTRLYGDAIGAAFAANFAVGCLALERQAAAPTPAAARGLRAPPVGAHVVERPLPMPIRHALVHGRDDAGRAVALVLGKA
ncbi:beta-ketoacyl synthase N-terminal-like domain-containing protein [Sorangium sp. So ce119]|uniref:beta-ketoacyl synthase N-terminal-like domain-containing protein n=1 Tax=Sorangium sp. So ce119 TaxID=3133279 RepID=UPI003F5F8FB2